MISTHILTCSISKSFARISTSSFIIKLLDDFLNSEGKTTRALALLGNHFELVFLIAKERAFSVDLNLRILEDLQLINEKLHLFSRFKTPLFPVKVAEIMNLFYGIQKNYCQYLKNTDTRRLSGSFCVYFTYIKYECQRNWNETKEEWQKSKKLEMGCPVCGTLFHTQTEHSLHYASLKHSKKLEETLSNVACFWNDSRLMIYYEALRP